MPLAAFSSGSRDRPGALSSRASWVRSRTRTARGRAAALSLALVVGFLLLGYAALRALELLPRGATPVRHGEPGAAGDLEVPRVWSGAVELGGARVRALLLPLHDEPALQGFRADALRARYRLPAGEPWRLYLSLETPSEMPVVVRTARVDAGEGAELVPFAELAGRGETEPDPVRALLAAPPGDLEVERARPLVLWGSVGGAAPRLELVGEPGAGSAVLAPAPGVEAPRWYAGEATDEPRVRSLEEEVARLRAELDREKARRAERELAFLEFSRMLAELPVGAQPGAGEPEVEEAPLDPAEEERRAADEAARSRAAQIGRSLAVLMRLEGLRGLDLLEAGTLHAGPPGAIGPVVFRCLDERGLLTGSVRAERVRLEASLAAHTLTLVLEGGFESRGGERVPFENGVRRITLTEVDPEPWLVECRELFDTDELLRAGDDGRWVLGDVRRELNRLLALDTRAGWFRLHALGGVRGDELCDVQLEELEPSGRLERRIFADRLAIEIEDGSVVLSLRDGAIVRGGDKQPFRAGRHRIVLPGVPVEEWLAAPLPGLAEPPAKSGDPAAPVR